MPNFIGTPEAVQRLHISKQAFHQSVLPLMIERGDAEKLLGRDWAIDPVAFKQWVQYANARRERMDSGEWSQRRPWSLEDLEALAGTEVTE